MGKTRRPGSTGTAGYQAGPLIAVGRLRNASLSGGYMKTAAIVRLGTQLHVELEWIYWNRAEHSRMPAYVVRSDENGVALEWCDFAPGWIALLISTQLPVSGADKRNLVDPKAQYALTGAT